MATESADTLLLPPQVYQGVPCTRFQLKMDLQKQLDDKLKRKRELANARMKRHREWKRSEAERLKSMKRDAPNHEIKDKEIQQNKVKHKREMARERSRRYRERKRLHALESVDQAIHDSQIQTRDRKRKRSEADQPNSMTQDESDDEIEERESNEESVQQQKEMTGGRSNRFMRKCPPDFEFVDFVVDDSPIPEFSHSNPPLLVTNQRTTVHDFQIAGTSKNVDTPLIICDDSVNVNCGGLSRGENFVIQENQENVLLPRNGDSRQIDIDDNSAPLPDQARASPSSTKQFNRSSATYSTYTRHSSAHIQFHKQFTQNQFGYACKICDRLWFRNDLKNLNDKNMEFVKTFLPNIDEHSIAVCFTCRTSIQKKFIPKMAVYNGFEYPKIPDDLLNCPLDLVSERLISPRIPFKQIRRLRHVRGQNGIYGQVINIPVDVNTMVNRLPRNINDNHCGYVHIKRKKIHKSSFSHGLVQKHTIEKWLQYLVNTPLYRTYNITIDKQFFDDEDDEESSFDGFSRNDVENGNNGHDGNDGDGLLEDIPIEESLLAQQQTVMWNDDLYLKIPPEENNLSVSFLFDEHAEELSFPSIYLGRLRQFREGVTVTPFMMANSELRRSDRRGVTSHHLLYMAMKIMRLRIIDSLTVASKHIGKKSNVTKEKVQSEKYIHNYIESNLAFLRSIPNSTWYWSERKKDLFAMIRQLGKPSVFFTISANEIGWLDLLQLLYKLNKHVHITKKAISQLHFMVKSTLINEDAITCAIYFNKLIRVTMNILQSKTCSPFGKYRVLHYFKHIDFQRRGSPQAHILAWLDNTPQDALNKDYDKAIELIDTLTSVSAVEASGSIKLQTHKHTSTCYNKITPNKAQKCRSEAPFMPCKKTMILTPMKDTEVEFINYRQRYAQIKVRLANEDFADMNDFYNRNGINSDEDYCNIIRAGITRPKVFVKREPSEKWHIPFNPFILNIVRSDTEFQFITDQYSCAAYLVEYVNKTNRGVSHLQRQIIETMNEHPEFDISELTKNIGVNVLNHTEITSQEAAWYLLREPMSKTSVIVEYIPTVWPIERQRIKKTMKELSKSDDDCHDIWRENWFAKYARRAEQLENVTLAQFVSKYTENREGEFVERREPKIIRYRNYDRAADFNEYKREMVTLHLPFRNEEEEIIADMKFITIYDDNEDIILQRRKEFESNIDIHKIIQICRELRSQESPMDKNELQNIAERFPGENPSQQLNNSPNSEINSNLRLASPNKFVAIAEKNKIRKGISIYSMNCQSSRVHALDLNDSVTQRLTMLVLSETWTNNKKNIDVTNFHCVAKLRRPDCKAAGVAIFKDNKNTRNIVSSEMDVAFSNSQSYEFKKSTIGEICVAKCGIENGQVIVIVAIYISPDQSINKIMSFIHENLLIFTEAGSTLLNRNLHELPMILSLDSNVNFSNGESKPLVDFLKSTLNLNISNDPYEYTTNNGTTIDGVFIRYLRALTM